MIEFSHFLSPIGLLSILAVKEGVVKISFENESFKAMEGKFRNHLGMKIAEGTEFTSNAKNQLSKYLSGKSKSLDFPVVHINTPFRKRVLEVERKIPYGETRSYREVAHMVESPGASRAVGVANATNPLPLYYPCHRIINSSGQLGRYGGGSEMKQFLLDLELFSL